MGAEPDQLRRRRVVEAARVVGVAADRGEDRLVALGGGDHARVRFLAEADVEYPPDARLDRGVDQLPLIALAEEEMRM